MRGFVLGLFAASLLHADRPLPDPQELKQRLLQNLKKSEQDLEKYSCMVRSEDEELNADGSVKKRHTSEQERFFVNGVEIEHVLVRNGKPLSGGESKKEQDRVNYEVKKYSKPNEVQKRKAEDEREMDMFLRALKFTDERRETRDGRSTIIFDLHGDPDYHARKLEEKFAEAMVGRIWVDEDTGNIAEVRAHTERDIKIGGGLIASIHKGFRATLVQQRMPDGVWLAKVVEGAGDARAALFVHRRFHIHEELENCHLFSVETQQSIKGPETSSPAPKP